MDGTVRAVARPRHNQGVLYNGHKRGHAIKFQSVTAPNGMIANLFGPVEGKKYDSGMVALSCLLPKLQQHSFAPNGDPLCIYSMHLFMFVAIASHIFPLSPVPGLY